MVAKPGYNAGDTLRLLPPFLRAHYVTDADVEEFSAEQVLLVPQALKTLGRRERTPARLHHLDLVHPVPARALRARRVPLRARALHAS